MTENPQKSFENVKIRVKILENPWKMTTNPQKSFENDKILLQILKNPGKMTKNGLKISKNDGFDSSCFELFRVVSSSLISFDRKRWSTSSWWSSPSSASWKSSLTVLWPIRALIWGTRGTCWISLSSLLGEFIGWKICVFSAAVVV